MLERSLTSGGMIAASILLSRALAPVDRALPAWKSFVAARAGLRTLEDLLGRAPARGRRQALPRPQGHLVIEGLTYRRRVPRHRCCATSPSRSAPARCWA